MRALLTLGDLIADLCLDIESLPVQPTGHQTLSGLTLGPGGAGNTLVAAARLGLPTIALGHLGDDWIGERVLAHLNAEGVGIAQIGRLVGAETRAAVRLRAAEGGQVFMARPGVVGPSALPEAWSAALAAAGAVFVDGWSFFHNEPELIHAGVKRAVAAGVPVLFDPGPRVGVIDSGWLRTIARSASVLLVTEPEHQTLSRRLELGDLRALSELRAVVLKRGAEGCVISAGAERIVCPGFPVAAVDPTGAGDCFAAGVAWGLLTGQPWDVIGAVANAVGALKTARVGTALAAPTRSEVLALLAAHRPDFVRRLAPLND